MKLKNFIGILTIMVSISIFVECDAYAIAWKYNLQSALKSAEKLGKPLMVDFYTDWCGWCKKLDKVTYTNSKVIGLSTEFICVKIDGDKNSDLVRKYNIQGYPHILFLKSDGSIADRIAGYLEPAAFAETMERVLKNARPAAKEPVTKEPVLKEAASGKSKKQPTEEPPKKKSGFELTGILYDPNNPKAIINDTIVKVGDNIDDATVLRIAHDSVALEYKGRELTLQME